MTETFTFQDLKDILVNRVGLKPDDVVDDPGLTLAALGLDSLALVELQLAVQQRYGFTIPDEDAEKILTVGSAIDYTNRRIKEQG